MFPLYLYIRKYLANWVGINQISLKILNIKKNCLSLIFYSSVIQLLLTYGPFYKNLTTRGPLSIKWCMKQQIHNIWNWKKHDKWVRHWNYYTIANSNFITNLHQWDACGRGFSDTIIRLSIPVLVVQVRVYPPVLRLPFDFFFDLNCFIVENVLSHTYVFPNVQCIFSVKSFSLGNLSCWLIFRSSLQSLAPLVLHIFIKKCFVRSNYNYRHGQLL